MLRYEPSPIGVARHAWVNKPDTKYNTEGLYHTGLILEGAEANAYKEKIDAEVERAFAEELEKLTAKMKPGEKKKAEAEWSRYFPYIVEADPETGNPTGRLIFMFKQNAIIKQRDGTQKVFIMGIRDATNKALPKETPVFGGATIRTLYKTRNVKVAGTKQMGVRLDFSMVQLIKPAQSGGAGFDEVEGGYVHDAGEEQPSQSGTEPSANSEY